MAETCCNNLVEAMKDGTNTEGYGKAIYERDGYIFLSADLEDNQILYCPICGTQLSIDKIKCTWEVVLKQL